MENGTLSGTLSLLFSLFFLDFSTTRGATLPPLHGKHCTGYFNPRTPRGVRPGAGCPSLRLSEFQSTHPSRGATSGQLIKIAALHISIHAPLAGCDVFAGLIAPRLPVISIHAPLAGCDVAPFHARVGHTHFNPRTPCGVRPLSRAFRGLCCNFNPRTPCGVRPDSRKRTNNTITISIHAPLAGCDSGSRTSCGSWSHFNPRTPCGVRWLLTQQITDSASISIHAPLAGCPFFPGGIPTHRRRRTHPVSGKKCAYPG